MSTVSPDSVAQDQIRAFVERIMRLREEVKAINGDIREVYAEAKGNGFDKTVLGKVVNYIEKRATRAGELAEGEALFDLYLAAFDGATRVGTPVATHTHEAVGYDRLTGEVRYDIAGNGASGAETVVRPAASAPVSAQPLQQDSAEVARGAHNPEVAGSIPAPATKSEPASPPSEIAEPGDRGAVVPSAAPVVEPFVAEYAAPGVVVVERCPPEGIVAHPFAACWPVNSIDVSKGVREPIVKIGKLILDGRGRYFAARDAGIEYPVVQYDGTDPLLDCIRWNLASRKPSERQRRLIAQKLAKLEPARADDIMRAFDRHLEAAE